MSRAMEFLTPATEVSELFKEDEEFDLRFNCFSIPWRKNPAFTDDVAAIVTKWELDVLRPGTEEKRRHVVESCLGMLTAYSYPDAPLERLMAIARFIVCFFVADDGIDSAKVSGEDARNATTCYIKVLEGALDYGDMKSVVKNKTIERQIMKFSEAWEEMVRDIKDHQKRRMVEAMIEAFDMFRFETDMLRSKVVPNVKTYMWMRRMSSGVMPFIVAIDYVNDLNVDPAVFEDARVRALERICVDHVAVVNDMHSSNKEWVDGNFLNIIPLIAYNEGCGLEEAFERAAGIVKNLERRYHKLRQSVVESELGSMGGVRKYVDGIGSWMSGNAEWSWITARYNGAGWVPPPERSAKFTLRK